MPEHTYSVSTDGATASLTVDDAGAGRPFLLLHGGAGPASMRVLAARLAGTYPAHTLAPVHPGFALTDRPDQLASIAALARLYAALLEQLALEDVVVVGNSIGGWIAAELALLQPRSLGQLILIDAVGIDVPGHPVTDVAGLPVPEIMKLSFHDSAPFLRDPSTLSPEERTALAANQHALAVYAPAMTDPTLAARLEALAIPTIVLWGRSDGIVDVSYGRAYADAIHGARFQVLDDTGHMPQLETPDRVIEVISAELGLSDG
jgi:pimeloyl-ACP methyl ester carboxylesterase